MPGPFYGGLGMVSSGVERRDDANRAASVHPMVRDLQSPMVRDLQSRTIGYSPRTDGTVLCGQGCWHC